MVIFDAVPRYCVEHAFRWYQLLHPLCGNGYQAWSGLLSDIGEYTVAAAFLGGLITWYRRHNCHVHRCWRLQWRVHPDHGHPVCGAHHPEHPRHRSRHERHFLDAREHRYPEAKEASVGQEKPSRPPADPSN